MGHTGLESTLIQCDWCPYQKREIWTQTYTWKEDMRTEADNEVMLPQAEECLGSQKLEDTGKDLPLQGWEPVHILILYFWPPEFREYISVVWAIYFAVFAVAALGNLPTKKKKGSYALWLMGASYIRLHEVHSKIKRTIFYRNLASLRLFRNSTKIFLKLSL